jgi:hypothetical protein
VNSGFEMWVLNGRVMVLDAGVIVLNSGVMVLDAGVMDGVDGCDMGMCNQLILWRLGPSVLSAPW